MWTCPKCKRTLGSKNRVHYCEEIDIDEVFEGKDPHLSFIFDKVLLGLIDWPDMAFSATKNAIVFVRSKTFLVIRPMKTALDLKFYLDKYADAYPIHKCKDYNGKFETHIRLKDIDEVDEFVFRWIRKSYELV